MPKRQVRFAAQKKYTKEKVVEFKFRMYPTDEDIKQRISEREAAGETRTAYVRRLIREDIAKNN